jgi:catechol 2,3-dioxygenase-like lactoylglutathione lyase family enzyme
MDAKLIAFCATVDDKRARAFYEDVVGLKFVEDSPYAVVFDAWGTALRIQKVDKLTPHPFTQLGFAVDDIRAAVKELKGRGVVFQRIGLPGQDDDGVWASPAGAFVAWFKDPDGNTLSLTEH